MTNRISAVTVLTLVAAIAAAPSALADDPVVAGTDAAGVQYLPEDTRTVVVTPPPVETPPPPPEVAPVVTPPTTETAPSVNPPIVEPTIDEPAVDDEPKVAPEEEPVEETIVKPVGDTPKPKPAPTATVAAAATPTSGGLPFTGYDALPIAAGGLLLLLLGVALRRQAREHG